MDGIDIEVITARMVRGEHRIIERVVHAMLATGLDVSGVHVEAIVSADAETFPTIVVLDGATVLARVRWEFVTNDLAADESIGVRMRAAIHPELSDAFERAGGTEDI